MGLKDEKNDVINVDGDYTIRQLVRLFGYFGYERIKSNQFQRQFNPADSSDPGTTPTGTAFNWDAAQKNNEYDYGIGVDIYVIPKKLTLTLQHDYVRSDGFVDYTVFRALNPGETQDNIDIPNWDDYRLQSYMINAVYNVTKHFAFSIGYAYEKFKYNDAQIEDYNFLPSGGII